MIVAYDDSDGWYDHAFAGVSNPSQIVADALTGPGCAAPATPLAGQQGRCGYGPRQPLLVISPWAKRNAVDHTLTDQSSIAAVHRGQLGPEPHPGKCRRIAGSLDGLFDFAAKKGKRPRLRQRAERTRH